MDHNQLVELFQWMSLINMVILLLMTLLIVALRDWAARLHARLFGLQPEQARQAMYVWLGHYKVLIFFFNIVPYVALRLL